jgi:plastin-3
MEMLSVFQDSSIADAKVVIDLIDAIKPGTINYELVKEGGPEEVMYFYISTLTTC